MQILRQECTFSGIDVFPIPSVFSDRLDPKSPELLVDLQPNASATEIDEVSLANPVTKPVIPALPKKKTVKLPTINNTSVEKVPSLILPLRKPPVQPERKLQASRFKSRHRKNKMENFWTGVHKIWSFLDFEIS